MWQHKEELEKTRLCRALRGGSCRWCPRNACVFASNREELRCPQFAMRGVCPMQNLMSTEQATFENDGRLRCPKGLHTVNHEPILRSGLRPIDGLVGTNTVGLMSSGQKPVTDKPLYLIPLEFYQIPDRLARAIAQCKQELFSKRGLFASVAQSLLLETFGMGDSALAVSTITMDNIKDLHTLLFIDEAQKRHDMRRYDMQQANLSPEVHNGRTLWKIMVPSLAEKRPSVLRGDSILLHDIGTNGVHEGFVYFVQVESVLVHFDDRPRYLGPFNVYFTLTSTQWRQCHRAVDMALDKRVFIVQDMARMKPHDIVPLTPQQLCHANSGGPLQLTDQQQAFLQGTFTRPRQLHLLWGPPGTGKTTTLVATIAKLAQAYPDTNFLIVAPSNAAVDVITGRLIRDHPSLAKRAVRVNSLTRAAKDVSDKDVLRVCTQQKLGGFVFPKREELLARGRIVCSTLSTASRIHGVIGHNASFDFVICDECGQATEAELLLAAVMSTPGRTRFLLAGDHKQLGPILPPALASVGAARSPLERLMKGVNPATVASEHSSTAGQDDGSFEAIHILVDNFRSSPAIVDVFNPTYGNVLRARATEQQHFLNYRKVLWMALWQSKRVTRAAGSGPLPTEAPAAVFLHVDGTETREEDSPSWLNTAEKDVILHLAIALVSSSSAGSDIAILSPYAKQVQKIRGSLHFEFKQKQQQAADFAMPTVASVEMFQGKEAPVVFMSSVRSQAKDTIGDDVKRHLGFLRQPQRLNVAVSRPQALLVMVGNGNLLAHDPEWRRILELLLSRGCLLNWQSARERFALPSSASLNPIVQPQPASGEAVEAVVTEDEVVYARPE